MLDASGASAQLTTKAVRLYQGFDEVVSQGVVSSLHAGNARTVRRVRGTAPAWLFDPQTSGGLLGAVPAEAVARTLDALHQAGYSDAAVIGEVVPTPAGEAPAISLR
jgi:selenide, water dikinase